MLREKIVEHRLETKEILNSLSSNHWKRIDYKFEDRNDYLEDLRKIVENDFATIRDLELTDLNENREFGLDSYLDKLNYVYINSGNYIESSKEESRVKISYVGDKEKPHIIEDNIVRVREGETLTLILDYESLIGAKALRNSRFDIEIEENGKLNLVLVQRLAEDAESFVDIRVNQKAYSQFNQYFIDLGGRVKAISNKIDLEEGAVSQTYSLYLVDGEGKADLEFSNFHNGRRSESLIEGRGVVKDRAKKVFRGNLKFNKGASKSVGKEAEYAIILNEGVLASSIPTLKCDEDDVVGEHAASAGQINQNKLFYLMSRGLSEKEAEKLIVLSSFKPIIAKIGDKALEELVAEEVNKRIF